MPPTSREADLTMYRSACTIFERSQWLALALMMAFSLGALVWMAPLRPVLRIYDDVWYAVAIVLLAVQVQFYVAARRARLALARRDNSGARWLVAFTFAPDERRNLAKEGILYTQDLYFRHLPVTLLFVVAFTIAAIQNMAQGQPPL